MLEKTLSSSGVTRVVVYHAEIGPDFAPQQVQLVLIKLTNESTKAVADLAF
jgi:hypothetical protein